MGNKPIKINQIQNFPMTSFWIHIPSYDHKTAEIPYIPSQPNQISQEAIVGCYEPYAPQFGQVGQTVDRWGC